MSNSMTIGQPGYYDDATDMAEAPPQEAKWSARKSILFLAGVCSLSWMLIAAPFVLLF